MDTAGLFNMLMRNADIVPISDMTGIMEFAGIWKSRGQVYGAPGYYAFRMYSTAHPATPVEAVSDAGSYSVKNGVAAAPRDRGCAVPGRHRRARSFEEIALHLLRESQSGRRYSRRYRDSRLRSRFRRGRANAAKLRASAMRTMMMIRSVLFLC